MNVNIVMEKICGGLLVLVVSVCFAIVAAAQEAQPMTLQEAVNGFQSVTNGRAGLVEDWSSHHVVFSRPGPGSPAYNKVTHDPRYWMQQIRRLQPAALPLVDAADEGGASGAIGAAKRHRRLTKRAKIHKDWSVNLGSGAKVGAGQYPAKFSFDASSASCANDFVVFNTGLGGGSSQASIVGFKNIYSGCGGTVPTVAWAYNTGSSAIVTSVVLSLDGTQLAFAQGSNLVILKASSGGTITSPTAPTSVTNADYRTCTAPCMTTLALGTTDSNSAPYYDYASDNLYVGDNTGSGKLHKFSGIFLGSPAEVGAPWPASGFANAGGLGSPVFDSSSGNVFVPDNNGSGSGHPSGFLYRMSGGASPGTVIKSGRLDDSNGIHDAPLVDSSAGKVYYFAESDGSSHSGVYQLGTSFASSNTGTESTVGANGSRTLFTGAFDNIYFTSADASSPSGNLYVCGNTGGNATLYRIPISSNVIGASSAMSPALSSDNATCSPVTEFDNNGTDLAFASVTTAGNTAAAIGCPASGCVMSFNITAGTTPTQTASRTGAAGGTSGIVIDNNASSPSGASQVYFSRLSDSACTTGGTGGCAIQDSQSAL